MSSAEGKDQSGPIKISSTYDPLTPESRKHPDAPWVGIDRSDPKEPKYSLELSRLERLMLAYLRREISGCSVLIGGDRGAGKTSLVMKVVERLQLNPSLQGEGGNDGKEETAPSARFSKPLLVRVHGPKLFNLSLADRPPSRNALRLIAEGLHRALIDEMCDAMDAIAEEQGKSEMAGQFRMEMDEGPNPTRLREIWTLLSKDGKTLWPVLNRHTEKGDPKHFQDNLRQATAELVAVSSSIQVCKEIRQHRFEEDADRGGATAVVLVGQGVAPSVPEKSSPLKNGHGHEMEGVSFWKVFARLMVDGGKLVHPITGVFVGGLVFAALSQSTENFPVAVFAGLLSALSTTILLNFAAARNRLTPILTDSTLAALDRTLPTLFRRVEEAGLFPIVVIDELDKVLDTGAKSSDDLYERMSTLIRDLKYFVADQAFTCFLTGRTYYEHVLWECRGEASSRKNVDTFFTDRILVSHQPSVLLQYLDEVLIRENPTPEVDSVLAFLKCIYLYNARGHLSDLQSYLSRDHKNDDSIFITPGGSIHITDHAIYRDQVLYQLAVHLAIERKDTTDILRESPDLLQPLNRVLYAASRIWESHESDSFTLDEVLRPSELNSWKKFSRAELDVLKGPVDHLIGFLKSPGKIFDKRYWPDPGTPNANVLRNALEDLKPIFVNDRSTPEPLIETSKLFEYQRHFFTRSSMFNSHAARTPNDQPYIRKIRSDAEKKEVKQALVVIDELIGEITNGGDRILGLFQIPGVFSYTVPRGLQFRSGMLRGTPTEDEEYELAELAHALGRDVTLLRTLLGIAVLVRLLGNVIPTLDALGEFLPEGMKEGVSQRGAVLKDLLAERFGKLEREMLQSPRLTAEMKAGIQRMRMTDEVSEFCRVCRMLLRRVPTSAGLY